MLASEQAPSIYSAYFLFFKLHLSTTKRPTNSSKRRTNERETIYTRVFTYVYTYIDRSILMAAE